MKTKHIPARLEHFRIGRVIELDSGSEGWVRKEILTSNDLIGDIRAFRQFPDKFRIPLITPEDIEDLGWEHDEGFHYKLRISDYNALWLTYDPQGHQDSEKLIEVDGKDYSIQTRIDLVDLMRLMGIVKID